MDEERISDCIWISEKLNEAHTRATNDLTERNVWQWVLKQYIQLNTRLGKF